MSYIKTDWIIKTLCKETGEPDFLNYNQLLGYVLDGIKDLSLFAVPEYKVCKLTINSFNSIEWPIDCIKPLSVCLVRNEQAVVLDIDDNIIPQKNLVKKKVNNWSIDDLFIHDAYDIDYLTYSFAIGELYGFENNINRAGYIKHDKLNRQSYIKGSLRFGDEILFYYKSDGLENCPDSVPSEYKEALEFFALAKYYRSRNPGLAEVNRKNYKEEFTRLRKYYQDEGINSWIDALRNNVKSSPKF